MRISTRKKKKIAGVLCVILMFIAVYTERSKEQTIVFVHTNDTHGTVMAVDGWGGLAERATLIDSIRRAAGGNILLLDAGDWNTGQAISNHFCARPDIEAYNYMGYDAVCLGNHEFDIPLDSLRMQMELMAFPVVTSNVFNLSDYRNGKALGMQCVKKKIGNQTVGIFGITTKSAREAAVHGTEVVFEDEVETAELLVRSLRGAGVDLVVAVVHMGIEDEGDEYTTSLELAKRVRGIDLIIDGHSHTFMKTAAVVNNTRVVTAYQYGHYIGVGKLVIKDRRLLEFDWELVPVHNVKPDYELGRRLKRWTERAKMELEHVVGKMAEAAPLFEGDRNLARCGESAVGNLVADGLAWKTRDMGIGVDFALINGGSVREGLPEGWVTKGDVVATVPFGNEVRVVEMYGSDVLDVVCELARVLPGNGSFPQYSGEVRMVLDTVNRHVLEFTVGGEEVDLDRVYKVVTYDYITEGRGRFKMLKERKMKEMSAGFEVVDGVMDYIHELEVVVPKLDGRMRIGRQEEMVEFEAKHLLPKYREEYRERERKLKGEVKEGVACDRLPDGSRDNGGR